MAQKVVHFEIPADDVERVNQFYKTVFGWSSQPMPGMDYTLLQTGPTDAKTGMVKDMGFINGGLMKREKPFKGPLVVIEVDRLDATIKKLEKAGGKVVSPRQTVPNVGDVAYFADPDGNVMGLIEPAAGPPT